MKLLSLTTLFLSLGALTAGCGSTHDANVKASSSSASVSDDAEEGEDDDSEEAIALDRVPANVLDAARAAIPGITLASAELETEKGQMHYCVHGTAAGEAIEIEISTDGDVLEIERGEEEDDD